MDKKLVTILLPAYNEEASFPIIERCMNQVLEENPNYNWEFLFINDGSKDNTLQQIIFHLFLTLLGLIWLGWLLAAAHGLLADACELLAVPCGL